MKRRLLLAVLILTMSSIFIVPEYSVQAEGKTFKDVTKHSLYYKEIMALTNLGVINGYPDDRFVSYRSVSRAEFATFIARALELPQAESHFKDVPKTAPLYDGVSRAAHAGIINGYTNGSFKPNENVKRQDVAVMIDRALQYKGIYTSQAEVIPYSDRERIPNYALGSVDRVFHYDIMGAYVLDSFRPHLQVLRGETANFLYYMLQAIERETAVN